MIDANARVCVRCGEPFGNETFCPNCGLNLSAQPELPTRREWEVAQRIVAMQGASVATAPVAPPTLPAIAPSPIPTAISPGRRITPYWWVAAGGLALCSLAIVIYSAEAIRWISDVSSLLTNGDVASAIDASAARRAADGALVFYYIAIAISGVCFIIWFQAAYDSLHRAGARLRFSRGWSIGSWFVPFLNLVRPKQIANDIWRGSHALADGPLNGPASDVQIRSVSASVHWWWGLYLAGSTIFGIGAGIAESHGSAGDSLEQILKLERVGF